MGLANVWLKQTSQYVNITGIPIIIADYYCFDFIVALQTQSESFEKNLQTNPSKLLRAEAFAAAGPLGPEAEGAVAGAANRDW